MIRKKENYFQMIKKQKDLISSWLYLTQFYDTVSKDLESALKEQHQIALKEFYVLLFLSEVPDKQLLLQELRRKVRLKTCSQNGI
ncbi:MULTISPECIES: hypothetical protein [Priestia]|uniref:hypothetical protein n=1 Tax=Priestia TaxID=2800373 RepID=UPI002FFE59B1